MESKPAIIVHSCDSYEFCWDIFCRQLDKFWPRLDWPIYFVSEELLFRPKLNLDFNSRNILTGKGGWTERLITALQQIPEEHVLYMQEDFFITSVQANWLQAAFSMHLSFENDITKTGNNYEFYTEKFGLIIDEVLKFYDQPTGNYIMSHQPIAFFKKEFLLRTLHYMNPNDGPSEHELDTTIRINNRVIDCKTVCIGPQFIPNKSLIITYVHGVRRGQIIPEASSFFAE